MAPTPGLRVRCPSRDTDGAHLQLGVLASPLAHLVAHGALRRGSVVRVLEYYSRLIQSRRVVVVIQLEILQAECALIGNPTIYEANATGDQPVVSNSSSLAGHGLLDSSVTPRAEPAVNDVHFSECLCSMPAQNTADAKMQQLSLNDHGN
ncbi:hypothetical protein U9M48_044070 [Paspalum notatum var. saurae]|uniref:Replication factor-A protein 1 N-terminal domain-containing protein n=1 Tax=Paspalum notatum var. saurae TaxID=547442 RepID=A0AAQ3UYA8_PASNO